MNSKVGRHWTHAPEFVPTPEIDARNEYEDIEKVPGAICFYKKDDPFGWMSNFYRAPIKRKG